MRFDYQTIRISVLNETPSHDGSGYDKMEEYQDSEPLDNGWSDDELACFCKECIQAAVVVVI